ncbi:hypothetical protein FW778_20405 [Ginsengibacter hankyongi]|uniref:Uncharacterized protein n=1 Tax=Ginsengibacter hankyongi TaxID=2607284 RepID=A0A5J5IB71_9BACT|nr:hypothetical protein [Ginsengibacter hankyongi]KAA9035913.1 hypothetical protein FW778_20405 [Ginsengibacter hankyongi]
MPKLTFLITSKSPRPLFKRNALKEILNGNVTEENYALLEDDWTIDKRCSDALKYWQLAGDARYNRLLIVLYI